MQIRGLGFNCTQVTNFYIRVILRMIKFLHCYFRDSNFFFANSTLTEAVKLRQREHMNYDSFFLDSA